MKKRFLPQRKLMRQMPKIFRKPVESSSLLEAKARAFLKRVLFNENYIPRNHPAIINMGGRNWFLIPE